jgi:hypothetical protein
MHEPAPGLVVHLPPDDVQTQFPPWQTCPAPHDDAVPSSTHWLLPLALQIHFPRTHLLLLGLAVQLPGMGVQGTTQLPA